MLLEVILQRLHGYLSSDLVAVLEAIGHGFSWRINSHRHAVDLVRVRAFRQRSTGEIDRSHRKWRAPRPPGMDTERNPNFRRRLRRQTMELERTEQAYGAPRNRPCNLGQAPPRRHRRIRIGIEA